MHQFSFSPIPILDPKTYVSPSGEYRLFINPSHRYGAGAALYRVTRDKTVLWEGERPFTLWQAGITDTGIVAGYGYSQGKEGHVGRTRTKPGFGDFEIVLLAPDGSERLHEKTKRTPGLYPHTLPNPLASGLLVDSPHDRFVVRRHDENYNRGTETWQVYSLTTGQRQADLTFTKTRAAVGILVAELVPGTPLTLLHWWRYVGGESSQLGALFTLVDLTGETVWSRALPPTTTFLATKRHSTADARDQAVWGDPFHRTRAVHPSVRRPEAACHICGHTSSRRAWQVSEISGSPTSPLSRMRKRRRKRQEYAPVWTTSPPVLNPKTYTSPSGEYTALVNPTNREGGGPAHYRVKRGRHSLGGEASLHSLGSGHYQQRDCRGL